VTKRVTLNLGYEITTDNGRTNWLRSDDGSSLMVVGDIYGNSPPLAGNPITPCPGASTTTGCIFPGPFPDQPLGPQAINWHKMLAGVAIDVTRGVQFKGTWNYYDYNSKDEVPSLSLLQVTAPRDFHANVGTLSLKYSF
jgi:opacity protein-like surface antigen